MLPARLDREQRDKATKAQQFPSQYFFQPFFDLNLFLVQSSSCSMAVYQSSDDRHCCLSKSISLAGLRKTASLACIRTFNAHTRTHTHTHKLRSLLCTIFIIMTDLNIFDDTVLGFFDAEIAGILKPTSLTYNIHPLYQPGKFALPCSGSQTISQLFWQFMMQGLHLTEPLLCQPFNSHTIDNKLVAIFPEPKASAGALTGNEQRLALSRLAHVMNLIDFAVGPTTAEAVTTSKPWVKDSAFPGCGSTITIGFALLKSVNDAFLTENVMLQQYYMFYIAYTMFHEMAHAIAFAVLPIPFFGSAILGNDLTDELGFEVQARLFGGLIQPGGGSVLSLGFTNYLDFSLVQKEWAIPHIIDQYAILPHLTPIITRADINRTIRLWRVPFDYINNMFQDTYWASLSLASSMRLYRRIGIVAVTMPFVVGQQSTLAIPRASDPLLASYVPDGFVVRGRLLMRA